MAWGLRWDWGSGVKWGWSCPGLGNGVVIGRGRWAVFRVGSMGEGGAWSENLKPFTLSCTPCSWTEREMSGQCGDRRLCSRFWFGVDWWIQKGIRLEGLEPPSYWITNPPATLSRDNLWYQYNCRAINGQPEWSCKRWNGVYYRARQGNIRTTKETDVLKKKQMHGYLFLKRWIIRPFATEC